MKLKKVKTGRKLIYGLGGALATGGVAVGTTLGVIYSQETKETEVVQVVNPEVKETPLTEEKRREQEFIPTYRSDLTTWNNRISILDKLARSLPNSRGYQRSTTVTK